MAREDDLDLDVEAAEAQAPKSKTKLLIIIAVVVLLGISGAATLALTGMLSGDAGQFAEDAEAATKAGTKAAGNSAEKQSKSRAPLNYVPLDPAFVVNFSSDTDIRFLQISVEVGTRDPAVVDSVKEHRPAIRNSLVLLFSSQDPHTLNTREGKEKLREETLAEVQKVLKQETGAPGVENVFFTSFVMQ